MRTRVLQALIVLAALGLTAGECVGAERTATSPAGREAVETLGRLVAGGSKDISESRVLNGAEQLGKRGVQLDTGAITVARQATVQERNTVAAAIDASASDLTPERRKEVLGYGCKVFKVVDPYATEQERQEALLDFLPEPRNSRKFEEAAKAAAKVQEAWNSGQEGRSEVLFACLAVGFA